MVEVIPAGCWFSVVGIFSIQHSTPAELLRCAGPRPRPVYQVPQKPPQAVQNYLQPMSAASSSGSVPEPSAAPSPQETTLTKQARQHKAQGNTTLALQLYKQSLTELFQLKDTLADNSTQKQDILAEIEILLKEAEQLKAKTRAIEISSGSSNSSSVMEGNNGPSSTSTTNSTSNNGTISLRILGHRVTKDNVTKYGVEVLIQGGPTARTICGLPAQGQDERWILEKRYSQFEKMAKALKAENSKEYTAAPVVLPKKNFALFGNESEAFVKQRTEGLATMLNTIQNNSALLFTQAIGGFMSSTIEDIRQRETMQSFLKRKAMEEKRQGSGGQDEMRKARLARFNLHTHEDDESEEETKDPEEEEPEDAEEPEEPEDTKAPEDPETTAASTKPTSTESPKKENGEEQQRDLSLAPVAVQKRMSGIYDKEITKGSKPGAAAAVPNAGTTTTSPSNPTTSSPPPALKPTAPNDAYTGLNLRLLGYKVMDKKTVTYGVSAHLTNSFSKLLVGMSTTDESERWIMDKTYTDFIQLFKTLKKKHAALFKSNSAQLELVPPSSGLFGNKQEATFLKKRVRRLETLLFVVLLSNCVFIFFGR
jgi:hypothetical protein